MDVKAKIRDYINTNLMVFDEDAEFTDSDNIFEMGFVNSLFAMKLLNYIEKEFKLSISNSDMEISNFSSVNNIERLIERLKEQ